MSPKLSKDAEVCLPDHNSKQFKKKKKKIKVIWVLSVFFMLDYTFSLSCTPSTATKYDYV